MKKDETVKESTRVQLKGSVVIVQILISEVINFAQILQTRRYKM